MAVERVTIVKLEPDALHVSARDQSCCSQCTAKAGCGHHLLQAWPGNRTPTVTVPLPAISGPEQYRPGDTLALKLDDRQIAVFSLLLYFVPLAAMLLATAAASAVKLGEGWVILCAASALVAGLAGIRTLGSMPGNSLFSRLESTVPANTSPV